MAISASPNRNGNDASHGGAHDTHGKVGLTGLIIGAIGVVFGDIGTSPLYTIKASSSATSAPARCTPSRKPSSRITG
jgi:K+ transporter